MPSAVYCKCRRLIDLSLWLQVPRGVRRGGAQCDRELPGGVRRPAQRVLGERGVRRALLRGVRGAETARRRRADQGVRLSLCFHSVFTVFSLCFHSVFTLFSLCFHCVLLYGIVRLFSLFFIDRWCLPAPCSDHFPHLLVDESPNDTEPAAYF